jgi:urease accessory protein
MLNVNKLIPRGEGLAPVLLKRASTVVLDWQARQAGQLETDDSQSRALKVSLAKGSVIRGGDVLVGEDGSLIKVIAKPQAVLVVRTCAQHGTPVDLTRAAYCLGIRQVTIELQDELIQLQPDPALAALMRGMHLDVSEELAPFEPQGHENFSGPSHACEHDHLHGHTHAHGHDHSGCSHDHSHDH